MVENIGFSEDGKKIVTEINGKHSSMLMDIEVIKMKKGDKIVILEPKRKLQYFLWKVK